MQIPQEIRSLIETGTPAHLVTINRDGSPQVTMVWIALDGDEIISAHLSANQKVKNIRQKRASPFPCRAPTAAR